MLGGFAPSTEKASIVKELKEKSKRLGRCYPANAVWLYWTLAALGDTEEILKDFDRRWINMLSVRENNTIQENWFAQKDTQNQLSHAGIAPFYAAYMCFAGIEVLKPGGGLLQVKPQMGSMEKLQLTYHTALGPLEFDGAGKRGDRRLRLNIPSEVVVHMVVPENEPTPKGAVKIPSDESNWNTFRLQGGRVWEMKLQFC